MAAERITELERLLEQERDKSARLQEALDHMSGGSKGVVEERIAPDAAQGPRSCPVRVACMDEAHAAESA